MIAIGRLVDVPHSNVHIMVHVKPNKIVGFRPNVSEALPQMIAVVHCDNEKAADVIPAHLATLFSLIPKLSIISGCHVMSVLVEYEEEEEEEGVKLVGSYTYQIWIDRSQGYGFSEPAYCYKPSVSQPAFEVAEETMAFRMQPNVP